VILLDSNVLSALMQQRFEELIQVDLAHRIAIFDVLAATVSAKLAAERKRRGRLADMRDTFIAGITIARGASLATRNIRHFEDIPAPIINRWG
jgi:predicted nucleic acid-binding protein